MSQGSTDVVYVSSSPESEPRLPLRSAAEEARFVARAPSRTINVVSPWLKVDASEQGFVPANAAGATPLPFYRYPLEDTAFNSRFLQIIRLLKAQARQVRANKISIKNVYGNIGRQLAASEDNNTNSIAAVRRLVEGAASAARTPAVTVYDMRTQASSWYVDPRLEAIADTPEAAELDWRIAIDHLVNEACIETVADSFVEAVLRSLGSTPAFEKAAAVGAQADRQTEEWSAFVEESTAGMAREQGTAVTAFWTKCSNWQPRLPLPRLEKRDETFRFSWSRAANFLDLEIWPDGLCEWFLSAGIGADAVRDGTPADREPVPAERLLSLVERYFGGRIA